MVRTSIGLRQNKKIQKNFWEYTPGPGRPWSPPPGDPFRGSRLPDRLQLLDAPNVLQYYVYYNIAGQLETLQDLHF